MNHRDDIKSLAETVVSINTFGRGRIGILNYYLEAVWLAMLPIGIIIGGLGWILCQYDVVSCAPTKLEQLMLVLSILGLWIGTVVLLMLWPGNREARDISVCKFVLIWNPLHRRVYEQPKDPRETWWYKLFMRDRL